MTAYRLGIAAESAADARVVARLADHVLEREVPWLAGSLDEHRQWTGRDPREPYFDLHGWKRALDERGIRLHGRFRSGDERMYRGLMILFEQGDAGPKPDALVLCRDTDGDEARRRAAQVALEQSPPSFPVVLALPTPELEAWHVAGFEPESDEERARLEACRAELGFDPRMRSAALTSTRAGSRADAKRVLARLTDDDEDRKSRCADSAVAHADARGRDNGLAAFLDDVETTLARVFRG